MINFVRCHKLDYYLFIHIVFRNFLVTLCCIRYHPIHDLIICVIQISSLLHPYLDNFVATVAKVLPTHPYVSYNMNYTDSGDKKLPSHANLVTKNILFKWQRIKNKAVSFLFFCPGLKLYHLFFCVFCILAYY